MDAIRIKGILDICPSAKAFIMLKQIDALKNDDMRRLFARPPHDNLIIVIVVEMPSSFVTIIEIS